jgi:protein involved in polysaccharide export with SLBB domain
MRSILSLFLVLFLAACATPVHNSLPAYQSQTNGVMTPQEDYRIQTGDQLDIKFFYNSELNESVVVRPDGRISLQLLSEIKVHDMTPSQLEDRLKERYVSQLAKPEVAVIVRSFNMQKVFVDGHVVKPGALPLIGFMTVMQSISQSGGLRDGARKGEILVIRRGDQGQPVVLKVNLKKAMKGEDVSQDIYLAPFDIVFVPKSAIGDVNQFVDLYIRKNLPIGAGVGYSIPSY